MPSLITRKDERKDSKEIEKEERGLRLLSQTKRKRRKREREKEYFNGKEREKLNKIYYFFLALRYSAHL